MLLADPDTTLLAPLVQRLLLQRVDSLGPLWVNARLESLHMADVLQAR